MKKNNITTSTTNHMSLKGDVFIIPNGGGCLNNYGLKKHGDMMLEIASLNGCTIDLSTEPMIQIWMTDPVNENWQDHLIEFEDDWKGRVEPFLPVSLLRGKKEGETINLTLPISMYRYKDGTRETRKEQVSVSLLLNQKGYRYSRFGGFEDALKYVLE